MRLFFVVLLGLLAVVPAAAPVVAAAAAAAAASQVGARRGDLVTRFMNNTNFPAHNLPGGGCDPVVPSNYTTPKACQAACDGAPRCDMWTFVPARSPGNPSHMPWCCQKTCAGGKPTVSGEEGGGSSGDDGFRSRRGGCEPPDTIEGVVSGAKRPADWLPPNCTSQYCFSFQPDWASGGPTTTLPTSNFSVRKLEAVRYRDGRTYAFADIVNFTDFWYPDSYSSEIGVFSSANGLTNWSYHGIVIRRGPTGNWDAGGVASPGVAIADDGTVLVGYAAESNSDGHLGTRGIGLASAPHPLGPFTKHIEPLASPFADGICSQKATGAKGWVACDDVIMETRPGGEIHIYHSLKGGAPPPGPGIRHMMSSDRGKTWGNSTLVLSTTLQPGTYPAETIAGRYFPSILGGRGGMVLITDGGPGFALHAYLSKVPGDMTSFVAAEQVELGATERPAKDWANLQLEFIPGADHSLAVAYSLYTGRKVWSQQHNNTVGGYTHTVFQLTTQPHLTMTDVSVDLKLLQ
jgi:hypothetical protein